MATKRIKDITGSTTTPASDDYVPLDGVTNGTRKITADNLLAAATGTYLEESNNLSDVASAATSRTNLDVYSTTEVDNQTYTPADVNDRTNARLPSNAVSYNGTSSFHSIASSQLMQFGDGANGFKRSITFRLKLDALDSSVQYLLCRHNNLVTQEWSLAINASNRLGFTIYDEDASANISTTEDAQSLVAGEWAHIGVTYDGGTSGSGINLYVNGSLVASTDGSSGSFIAAEALSQVTQVMHQGSALSYTAGQISDLKFWNRELSASEVLRDKVDGSVPIADQWGGAATYTSDFSVNADGWDDSSARITVTGDIDTVGGQNDNLELKCSTDNNTHFTVKTNVVTVGTKYRISYDAYVSSGNDAADGWRITDSGAEIDAQTPTKGSWASYSGEWVATNSANITLQLTDGGATSFADAGGDDTIYFRNITIEPIGAVVSLQPENIVASGTADDGDWVDASSNNLNASSTNATPLRVKPQVSGSFTPTLTLGGTNAGLTFSTQQGNYRKLDDKTVHIEVNITTSGDTGADTGDLIIGGLPFQAVNRSKANSFAVRMTGSANLTSAVIGEIEPASTQIKLYDYGATGAVRIADDNVGVATLIQFSATYEIA